MTRRAAFGAGLLLFCGACAAAERCPAQVRVSLPNFEIAPYVLGTDKVESPPGLLVEWTRQALARSGCKPRIVIMRRPPNRQLAETAMGMIDVLPGFTANGNQRDHLIFPTRDGVVNAGLAVMSDTISLYARANDMSVRWDGTTLRSINPLVGSSTGGATTDAIAHAHGWRIEPAPTPQADLRKLIAGRIDVILEPDVVLRSNMSSADARAVRRLLPPVRVSNRYAPVGKHFHQAYPEFTERFWLELCRQSRARAPSLPACSSLAAGAIAHPTDLLPGASMHRLPAFSAGLVLATHNAFAQPQPVVTEGPLRAHLAFLADDLLEGRGTGQRGGDLAVRYLETQAAAIGLKPAAGKGYRQSVKMVGTTTLPTSAVRFEVGGKVLAPALGSEILVGNANGKAAVRFDAPVVFAGYGIDGADERWNDFSGVDVKGKLLIVMVNDPKPTAAEPNRFGGKSLTYYGRWMYKYEEAVRQGAAGILLIHTTESASYPWSVPATSFGHEHFALAGAGNALQGWIQEDAARTLFAAAGKDLDALRAQAEVRGFKPVDLGIVAHAAVDSTIRQVEQFNVAGIVPGTDPALKEQAVIYSAHWDHLGIGAADGKPDHIWNGAIDNASGSAALLAMAQAALAHPARRTQIFLWPCAEEQGLLGALAYVRNPLWPLAKTAADLNLDSMNFVGKTRDMGVAGSERSSLHASAAQVAKRMGLRLAPTVPDLGGAYFRADHFMFAKAGVPAFNVGSAVFSGDGSFDFATDPDASRARMVAFKKDYHQVSDQYNPDWDLAGMVQQAQFTLNLGYAVANAPAMPAWNRDDPLGKVKR